MLHGTIILFLLSARCSSCPGAIYQEVPLWVLPDRGDRFTDVQLFPAQTPVLLPRRPCSYQGEHAVTRNGLPPADKVADLLI